MLQWFTGPSADTADSAPLMEAPVGNNNEIKPVGTRTKTSLKLFGWLLNITGSQLPAVKCVLPEVGKKR